MASVQAPPPTAITSRFANPFATCWTRPGTLPFRFAAGQSAEILIETLTAQNWRGAIVGPHGSGKSTLLEALKPAAESAGRSVYSIVLRDRHRWLPAGFLPSLGPHTLVVIDGYEQLGRIERLRIAYFVRRTRCGILVTSHRPTQFPTLISLTPDVRLVQQLVADLVSRVSTSITAGDVTASHACHGGNVREVFFDLYMRHERLRRAK